MTSTGVSCLSDSEFISAIRALRAALPRPYLLTMAAWSVGAYGQGKWLNSQPGPVDHTGMSVNPLKHVGSDLDILNVSGGRLAPVLVATQSWLKGGAVLPHLCRSCLTMPRMPIMSPRPTMPTGPCSLARS